MLKSFEEQAARIERRWWIGCAKILATAPSSSMSPGKRCDSAATIAICSHKAPTARSAAEGIRARHVVAFSRATANQTLIAVTGRFFLKLCNSHGKPIGDVWGNTTIALPKKAAHQTFAIFSPVKPSPRKSAKAACFSR